MSSCLWMSRRGRDIWGFQKRQYVSFFKTCLVTWLRHVSKTKACLQISGFGRKTRKIHAQLSQELLLWQTAILSVSNQKSKLSITHVNCTENYTAVNQRQIWVGSGPMGRQCQYPIILEGCLTFASLHVLCTCYFCSTTSKNVPITQKMQHSTNINCL